MERTSIQQEHYSSKKTIGETIYAVHIFGSLLILIC